MATNLFWIGYHFEEFRSQVAIRKTKKIHALPYTVTTMAKQNKGKTHMEPKGI